MYTIILHKMADPLVVWSICHVYIPLTFTVKPLKKKTYNWFSIPIIAYAGQSNAESSKGSILQYFRPH